MSAILNELQRLIVRHGCSDRAHFDNLPNIGLMVSAAPTQPFSQVCEPVMALVAQGLQRSVVGDKTIDCGRGQYVIVPVDLPMNGHVAEATTEVPFLSFGIKLKPEKIASLLLEAGAAHSLSNDLPGVTVSDAPDELLDPIVRLLKLLDRPSDIPVLAPAIEREILWRLLNGQQGAVVRQIGLPDSHMTHIGRAIRWLRAHYAEAFRIDDLAAVAGMSVTSFHRHFRAITAMTPIQYQKQIRLQSARSRLISAAQDVAEVGFAVGYDSPSQFSREYRRLFGHPPGKDRDRLRIEQ